MEIKDAQVMVNSDLRMRESERLEQIFETIKAPLIVALTVTPICYGIYYLNVTFGIIAIMICLAFVVYYSGRALDDLKSKEINSDIRELKQLQYQLRMGVNIFENITPENFREHLLKLKTVKNKKNIK